MSPFDDGGELEIIEGQPEGKHTIHARCSTGICFWTRYRLEKDGSASSKC
jgi:hypothetical protein